MGLIGLHLAAHVVIQKRRKAEAIIAINQDDGMWIALVS